MVRSDIIPIQKCRMVRSVLPIAFLNVMDFLR